mgnify:CR=1 FL=1
MNIAVNCGDVRYEMNLVINKLIEEIKKMFVNFELRMKYVINITNLTE